jgi:hypothetical protein
MTYMLYSYSFWLFTILILILLGQELIGYFCTRNRKIIEFSRNICVLPICVLYK